MEVKTTEFFKNIKSLPPKGTKEFDDLIEWEKEKLLGGITVNGVKFSGWLYWHLNHWHIRGDDLDKYGNIVRVPILPDLRDNEWIRDQHLQACQENKLGYFEAGGRQLGKSEAESSICIYTATLFQNSQNVIVGGDDADLSLIKDKIDFGIDNLWEGLRKPKIDKDWRKPMIRLGYRLKNGKDIVWSYLMIRNVTRGKNTEGPAGTTAKSYISDEVAKYPFGSVFEAAKPAFMSKYGWRLVPICVCTGGSFEKSDDAERYFNNPRANSMMPVVDPKTGKETALFMSGIYRMDCKENMTLSEWLIREGNLPPGEYPELDKITIAVADKEKARKKILQERKDKESDPDKTEYLKLIMYNPLDPDECFMTLGSNIFNAEIAKKQKERIKESEAFGIPVILKNTGSKIIHDTDTRKLPISSYPIKPNESKDAPPVIWEFPIEEKPPFGLYVAGVDPYRQGKAEFSTSLGAVYIYKRMHDIYSEKFQNMFVASYVARPDSRTEWWEQARWLIRYYNARTLVENDDISFIDYMTSVNDDHYLEPSPEWLKAVAPTSSIDRPYGLSTANPKIRAHVLSNYKKYTEERLHVERDSEGSIVSEILGVSRIMDSILLEETMKYNEDGNFDRIIAASLAVTLANHLDPIVGKITTTETDPRLQSYFNRNKGYSKNPLGNLYVPSRGERRVRIPSPL